MTDRPLDLTCAAAADLASGFVLGALEPSEMAAVRVHLATCPNPHAEFAELGSVALAMLESVELVDPPTALRGRIRAAATADRPAPESRVTAPGARQKQAGAALVRGPATWFQRRAWVAAAVAAVIVVALGARTLQLQSEIAGLEAYRNGVAEVLEAAAAPGSQLAVLAPPEGGSTAAGLAAIGPDGRLAIVVRELDETRGTEVYEAWLIAGEGAPVPVGSFRVGSDGAATIVIATGQDPGAEVVIALTREPQPGATIPTLPIIAVGTARPISG